MHAGGGTWPRKDRDLQARRRCALCGGGVEAAIVMAQGIRIETPWPGDEIAGIVTEMWAWRVSHGFTERAISVTERTAQSRLASSRAVWRRVYCVPFFQGAAARLARSTCRWSFVISRHGPMWNALQNNLIKPLLAPVTVLLPPAHHNLQTRTACAHILSSPAKHATPKHCRATPF